MSTPDCCPPRSPTRCRRGEHRRRPTVGAGLLLLAAAGTWACWNATAAAQDWRGPTLGTTDVRLLGQPPLPPEPLPMLSPSENGEPFDAFAPPPASSPEGYAPGVFIEEPGFCHPESGTVVDFPYEEPPLWAEILEATPTLLSKPDEHLGHFFERIICGEHDHVETELDELPLGLRAIPPRPPLIIEWNEAFLAPGFLREGIEMPTGVVWRPAFWVFGQYRTAYQYYDANRTADPISEWANRLDLFGQLNLSGTERVLMGLRPLDQEEGAFRDFTSYDFRDDRWIDGYNARFQTLFFEGDFGEIFPGLDPYDSRALDYGFSVGRMPLLAQQGLLINEDMIDAVTVTRNTLHGYGNLNLRITGVYAWRNINRNSPTGLPNDYDGGSKMVALLTESDFKTSMVNLDCAYVYGDSEFGDMFTWAASSIQRIYAYENTYNVSAQLLASHPQGAVTPYSDQGELLFLQTSWTPHHTEDLIYFNGFWAIDQFTSPARGPLMGGPLGQTGILFAAPALGRAGPALGVITNKAVGCSLGYQLFFDHTRQQVIWETGGLSDTDGTTRGAVGSIIRWQKAIGQHWIFILDGFVSKREAQDVSEGARCELLMKF